MSGRRCHVILVFLGLFRSRHSQADASYTVIQTKTRAKDIWCRRAEKGSWSLSRMSLKNWFTWSAFGKVCRRKLLRAAEARDRAQFGRVARLMPAVLVPIPSSRIDYSLSSFLDSHLIVNTAGRSVVQLGCNQRYGCILLIEICSYEACFRDLDISTPFSSGLLVYIFSLPILHGSIIQHNAGHWLRSGERRRNLSSQFRLWVR